ncbi:uncharacterized protein PG986_004782 [Apiospora aurea]|uniref:Secreted protein n=1 Tax=Apiospora aurea TaxID=335848 RepID=A0ABR1QNJ8_9PEZI
MVATAVRLAVALSVALSVRLSVSLSAAVSMASAGVLGSAAGRSTDSVATSGAAVVRATAAAGLLSSDMVETAVRSVRAGDGQLHGVGARMAAEGLSD